MTTHDYDAVVVGARPAGASTAMLLARMGHRVLLVDRAVMPSDTISTHALLRTAMLQLARWGLLPRLAESGTPPVRELTLGFDAERVSTALKAEHGIDALSAPRRIVLDQLLLDAALDAGVELADGTGVTDVLRSDRGRVEGVVTAGSDRRHITAQVVIGADGVNSRVARLAGAPTRLVHPPRNTVHYAYYEGLDHPGFWFQFTSGVNAGVIPTGDGLTCVFAGRPKSSMASWSRDPDRAFDRLLRHAGHDLWACVNEGRRVEPFRGTTGLPGFVRGAWGPGWALVGDAGYSIDPISAHGISSALRDAELCARGVDRWLRHPPCESDAMGEYEATRDALSAEILCASGTLAAYGWDGAEASRLMRTISAAVRTECDAIAAWPSLVGVRDPR